MKFKSLIAGLLAGTALGILFSPDKGDKIRKDIKKEVDKGGTGLSTIFGVYKKMGKEIGETAQVEKIKDYGKKLVKDNVPVKYQKQAKGAFQKAKSVAKKAVKRVKEEIDKRSNAED